MAEVAILHEIDKCVKCRACTVACERWYQLGAVGEAEKVEADDFVVVKSQLEVDNPPFVRYSCWHCKSPPCATDYNPTLGIANNFSGCPYGAVKIKPTGDQVGGAVWIDWSLCNPGTSGGRNPANTSQPCKAQCVRLCRRGGYPKIGVGSDRYPGVEKAFKCQLCYDWIAAQTDPNLQKPVCVLSCPMKALRYEDLTIIQNIMASSPYTSSSPRGGDGHVFWVSKERPFALPVSDPFIEDHISPMFDKVLRSPVGMYLAIPGVILGAIYAMYKRRIELSPEAKKA